MLDKAEIERIARGLCREDGKNPDQWQYHDYTSMPWGYRLWENYALKAVTMLREPEPDDACK